MVPIHSSLAQVDGALNAVLLRSHFVGDLTLIGKGAGGEPTANAVVSDIIDIARGHQTPAFSLPAARLLPAIPAAPEPKRHYIRLHVTDKPGVVADVSSILRDENISIESLIQRHQSLDNAVPVIMTTYESTSDSMQRALEKIVALPAVRTRPCLLSIED